MALIFPLFSLHNNFSYFAHTSFFVTDYPYLTNDLMKQTADACHALNMKYSIYNTMRELSNACMEVFALRSLGETYVDGNGGGSDWLQEHARDHYNPAWSTPVPVGNNYTMDAAMQDKALSRWNNYYVAGLQQMQRDFAMDGIYLDEIAYDRVTLLRARQVLGLNGLVDHHSDSGAFCRSPAINYMELYPFIDRLWYGEGFNYDAATADYWLVEMSGIPFGLTADMLRYYGMNAFPYRGMLVGSSNRWQSSLDVGQMDPHVPIQLWALWDQFTISTAAMFGWWLDVVSWCCVRLYVRMYVRVYVCVYVCVCVCVCVCCNVQ